MHSIVASYIGRDCDSRAPYAVYAKQNGDCKDETCSDNGSSEGEGDGERLTMQCSTDYLQAMRDAFAGSEYIIHEVFSDDTCTTFEYAVGFLVTDNCTGGALTDDNYFKSSIEDIGTASIQIFQNLDGSSSAADSSCSHDSVTVDAAKDQLERHTCLTIDSGIALYDIYGPEYYDGMTYKWYSSNDSDDSVGSSYCTGVH
ncbi:hypothetical protein PF008_g5163 [Phytophthora fragariae]|uniref:Uncharacterized protein n=1 Tax=Phytophthora fragariae TaxID=53985 RepID=A0A6G0S9T8_9STRA|nr:hypothetical protein PF008_g5163 [Phytophthora fragariae]